MKRKGKFEGYIWRVLLKGNSWYSVLWYWKNTFWSSFQCSHDFRRIWCRNFGSYSGSSRPLSFFFKGFITNKLTRIFVSFRVIHVLLSLMLFYRTVLDQISHTWFDWILVNDFSLCEENCMDKLKAAKNCIACVQHTLLPKK